MKILIINGPNLNRLSQRNKDLYGKLSLKKIERILRLEFPKIKFGFFQSNHEGEIIDKLQKAEKEFFGIVINPGGYAHTSVAIRDALEIIKIPKVEVHLSQLAKRESFRTQLITASACDGYIAGFKEYSYIAAVYLIQKIKRGET